MPSCPYLLYRPVAHLATAVVTTVFTLSAPLASAAASGSADTTASLPASASQDVRIDTPLALDAKRLFAMKPGEQVRIDFPVVGRRTVVFEAATRGLDGRPYWHGRLAGNAADRVFLKLTDKGLVGAVRLGGRQVALRQSPQGALALADAAQLVPVAGQAYALGAELRPGVHALSGNLAALAQLPQGSEIALPMPGGLTEVAIVTRSGFDENGFQQIVGVSRMDGIAYPTHLTISKDAVFGSVITRQGDLQIVTRQGQTQIIDPRAAGWTPPAGGDHVDASQDPLSAAILKRGGGGTTTGSPGASSGVISSPQPMPLPAGTVDTPINLLMAYSTSFSTYWGSEASARTRLANLVEVANSAYANSGTGVKFRIVGWRQLAVADATPQTQLNNLRLDAGAFAGTAAQKATQGAAMTVFFAPFNATTASTNTCGLAYVPAANAAGMVAYRQQAPSLMYAALNDGDWGGYYCESLSLAHELGHNLGAAHDKANSSFAGVFSYSYGRGVSGVFGTVMAYIYPHVALFSSPQLSCTADQTPCGTSTENVVATVLQTKSTVAALGRADAPAVGTDGNVQASGWLVNTNGTPYTGAATLTPSDPSVRCAAGVTGLYTCKVPPGVSSVTLSVAVRGRAVTPSIATFAVDRQANAPTQGARFHIK